MRRFYSKANINFILAFIFVFLLSFLASFFYPWWIIAVISFVVNLAFHQKPFRAFLSGFLALFILWGTLSLYLNSLNEAVLSKVVCKMFFNFYVPYLLNVLTALIGGLVGGLGALVASHFRAIVKSREIEIKEQNGQNAERFYAPPTPKSTIRTSSPSVQINPVIVAVKEKKEEQIKKGVPVVIAKKTGSSSVVSKTVSVSKPSENNNHKYKKVETLTAKKEIIKGAKLSQPSSKPNSISTTKSNTSKVKVNVKKPNNLEIPKTSSPFKVPSIKEQIERNAGFLKKKPERNK